MRSPRAYASLASRIITTVLPSTASPVTYVCVVGAMLLFFFPTSATTFMTAFESYALNRSSAAAIANTGPQRVIMFVFTNKLLSHKTTKSLSRKVFASCSCGFHRVRLTSSSPSTSYGNRFCGPRDWFVSCFRFCHASRAPPFLRSRCGILLGFCAIRCSLFLLAKR